jgi:predicted RNA binding protein YcfA (HicA-like mRNA interferase family)
MPKKYPPLSASEVVSILKRLGFTYHHSAGGHDFYKATHSGKPWVVTVDEKDSPFDDFLLKSMIHQSGYDRATFYAATKRTARKIGVEPAKGAAD